MSTTLGGSERRGTFELDPLSITDYGFSERLKAVAGSAAEIGAVGGGVNRTLRP